jgi:hypothetical protein
MPEPRDRGVTSFYLRKTPIGVKTMRNVMTGCLAAAVTALVLTRGVVRAVFPKGDRRG